MIVFYASRAREWARTVFCAQGKKKVNLARKVAGCDSLLTNSRDGRALSFAPGKKSECLPKGRDDVILF